MVGGFVDFVEVDHVPVADGAGDIDFVLEESLISFGLVNLRFLELFQGELGLGDCVIRRVDYSERATAENVCDEVFTKSPGLMWGWASLV